MGSETHVVDDADDLVIGAILQTSSPNRLPIGSSFAKYLSANVWLMIVT